MVNHLENTIISVSRMQQVSSCAWPPWLRRQRRQLQVLRLRHIVQPCSIATVAAVHPTEGDDTQVMEQFQYDWCAALLRLGSNLDIAGLYICHRVMTTKERKTIVATGIQKPGYQPALHPLGRANEIHNWGYEQKLTMILVRIMHAPETLLSFAGDHRRNARRPVSESPAIARPSHLCDNSRAPRNI